MIKTITTTWAGLAAVLLLGAAALSGCSGMGTRAGACPMPEGHNLDSAMADVRQSLTKKRSKCGPYFDAYMQELLAISEGDPGPDNKRRFSEFLVWASSEGIISKRQAQDQYNRYFNVKFVSLKGDYNSCSQACPNRANVMADMAQELSDKELGLLRVSADKQSYYRASQLYKETELVMEATCTACSAQR
jgi:hypothetical protein